MRTKSGSVARLLLAGLAALTGCAAPQGHAVLVPVTSLSTRAQPPATPETTVPRPVQAPAPPPRTIDPAAVIAAARAVEPKTTVGVLVVDLVAHTELLSIEPDRPFHSASLVKLLMAIDALVRGADEALRARIGTMLRLSDDGIANALWTRGGGPDLVARTGQAIGLTGTRPPAVPGQWGDVVVTARDVVRIYEYVLTRLSEPDRALVVGAMAEAPRTAADGFDQHFGIPAGLPGRPWAIKQGWGNNATDMVLHSSGLVGVDWRYVVVVLTEHPLRVAWRTAADSVTAAAQSLAAVL
jgi:hypothetical protein